ncbi:NACHT domain-containing protein [Streptomyces sp. NPDC048565]|uniref:NACHT domain-containing protein n=1 Tax=Streptomyces sp. NPDC048565 TaxID=3155266 RepID=UPI00341B457D
MRLGFLALSAIATLGLGWKLWDSSRPPNSDSLVDWAALLVAVASLVVSLVQLFPALEAPRDAAQVADDLAVSVRSQWEEEVTARNLRSPRVIPLAWSATRRPVAAPPEEALGGGIDARVLRLSLNGRLDGSFDQAARRLAQGYRRVPSRRLVMLGEPGSGKSVLAAMLNLGLLAEREQGAPVPVVLTLSTWDPVSESLRDWIESTLGTNYYGGRTEKPKLLLDAQRLLLILDGLDEMPEASRRSAVRVINESCGEGTGVVLTCRSAEYQDVIEGGSPVLRRAPVVEVAPVPTADGVAYLSDVSWPAGVEWGPVYEHLRTNPDSPSAVALSTPLTLTLARTVYSSCDRDPGELLDFDSSHAVEDHLLDLVVTAAYAPSPGSVGQEAADEWRAHAERSERYLTYLATYLHRHRERDLAWWLMSRRLLSRLTGFALSIGIGMVATFAVVGGEHFTGRDLGDPDWMPSSVLVGVGCALMTVVIWYAAPDRPPGRLSLKRGGSLGRLRSGFTTGLMLTGILMIPVAAAVAVAVTFSTGWSGESSSGYSMFVAAVAGVVLAISLALAGHAWLDAPPERSAEAGPDGLLRQDRTSSLTGALAAGVVLGATAAPLATLGYSVAFVEFSRLTYGVVAPSPGGFIGERFGSSAAYGSTTAVVMSMLLPAGVFALIILLTRAWPRFVLLRVVLALRGRLPWGLMRFLADARDRQLLRQSGGAYQFRHIRLQERLASRSLAPDRVPGPDARAVRRRRSLGAAATALLVVGGVWGHSAAGSTTGSMKTGDAKYLTFGAVGKNTLIAVTEKGDVTGWDVDTRRKVGGLADVSLGVDRASRYQSGFAVARGFLAYAEELTDEGDVRIKGKISPWEAGEDEVEENLNARQFNFYSDADSVSPGQLFSLSVESVEQDEGIAVLRRTDLNSEESLPRCRLGSDSAYYGMWAISDNGKVMAAADYSSVRIFDETCQQVDNVVVGYHDVRSIALNAAGTQLATNSDGVTRLHDLRAEGD